MLLLAWTIASLLRTVRASVVATVPIRAEQRVDINSSGDLALNLESPFLARIPASLGLTLSSASSRSQIVLTPILAGTHASSMSRARMELRSCTIPSPGTYTLRIDRLDASGFALIGSLVASGLILSGKPFSPAASSSYDPGSPST